MTDVPVWYKQTEIGIIPNDWTPWNLWDVSKVLYWFLFTPEYYRPGGKYKVITIWNIWDGYFDDNDCNKTDRLPYCFKQFQFINNWDILVSMTWACLWRVCRADKWWWVMNYRVGKMIWNEKVSNDYLYQLLRQKTFWNEMLWIWKWWAQPNISRNDILNFKIALPPTIEEQQAIATTLSDMDELISNLDKLIEKKKNIKKWAMQKLLTWKLRLPWFTWERKERELWDILVFHYWDWNVNPDNWWIYPIYWANWIIWWYHKFNAENSIIIWHIWTAWTVMYEKRKHFVTYNWTITTIKDNQKDDIMFMFYVLLRLDIPSICVGSSQPFLAYDKLRSLKATIPPTKEEQQAIASILSDMDKEIEALEQKKAKYENIKQWAMQKLLTGKIRLV